MATELSNYHWCSSNADGDALSNGHWVIILPFGFIKCLCVIPWGLIKCRCRCVIQWPLDSLNWHLSHQMPMPMATESSNYHWGSSNADALSNGLWVHHMATGSFFSSSTLRFLGFSFLGGGLYTTTCPMPVTARPQQKIRIWPSSPMYINLKKKNKLLIKILSEVYT